MNIHQPLPRSNIGTYDVPIFETVANIRTCRRDVIELVKIMNETKTIMIIHKYVPPIHSPIERVPKLHALSIADLGTS